MENDPDDIARQLRSFSLVLSRQLRTALRKEDIGHAAMSVLAELRRGGKLTPSELARREGVRPQTQTRLLAELEAQGWIERHSHANDGRQTLLSLSSTGVARLHSAVERADEALVRTLQEKTTAQERRQLRQACAVLERLGDALWEQGSAP